MNQQVLVDRNFSIEYYAIKGYQISHMESLILAQNERWRRGLGMQVERSFGIVAKG